MAIKLSLPTLAATPDPEVEIRAVYVEEWVEALAYANPPALLTEAIASIDRLNTQPLKPALRVDLLDLHVKPYAYALDFLRAQDSARTTGGLARQRDVSRRLRLCARALTLGYKHAASALLENRGRFGSNRDLRLTLQRSVLFAALELLHCYEEYRPAPQGAWLELIALHSVAGDAATDTVAAPREVDDPLYSASVDETFKRICLTSLVDPYHLAFGELWDVFRTFGGHAGKARLTEVAPARRPAGLFVINPALDSKPRPLFQLPVAPDQTCTLLDANPVLEAIRARHRAVGARGPLANHVLAAMIRALGLPPRRHAPRESSEGRVRVAVGLSTVHHFVGGDATSPGAQATKGDEHIEIGDATGVADALAAQYRHERWEVANEGPGGFGILRSTEPESPLGVGELIAMQFPLRGDGEHDWTVGVVRWLSINVDDEHQAGVQMLGTQATPVMTYLENVTETITRIPRPALAMPAISEQPGAMLMTPRGLYARGSLLRVQTRYQSWLLEARSLSESTATFDRFTYRIVSNA